MIEAKVIKNESKLLVVEDDPAMLIALRDILEGAGYAVQTAVNGAEAINHLANSRPSLILSQCRSWTVFNCWKRFVVVQRERRFHSFS